MKVEFTAEIIDDNGNVVGKRTSEERASLSGSITALSIPLRTASDMQRPCDAIKAVDVSCDEKIPFTAEELDIECRVSECVYVPIDNVGVKHQKNSRRPDTVKNAKYVEDTAVHIQRGQDTYTLVAGSMKEAIRQALAFLVFNGLLRDRRVFFTDGQGISRTALTDFSPSVLIPSSLTGFT